MADAMLAPRASMPDTAIILAGGLGTRLRNVVGAVPKPMAMVAGRPFLDFLLWQVRSWAIADVVLSVGYGAEAIREHVGDGAAWGLAVRYVEEDEPLGTGGALRLATSAIEGNSFLVLNGDSLFDVDVSQVAGVHKTRHATTTIALRYEPNAARFGTVQLDAEGRVTRFAEKDARATAGEVNAGIYICERSFIELIPATGPSSLETDVFPSMVGGQLFGLPLQGYFTDIGLPDAYLAANSLPGPLQAVMRRGEMVAC